MLQKILYLWNMWNIEIKSTLQALYLLILQATEHTSSRRTMMCSADESQLIRLLMQLLKAKKVIEIGKMHRCISVWAKATKVSNTLFVYLQTLPRDLDKSQSKLHYKVQKKIILIHTIMKMYLETTETAITNRIGANIGQRINNTFDQVSLLMAD